MALRYSVMACVPCFVDNVRVNLGLAMNIISNARNATLDFSTQLKSTIVTPLYGCVHAFNTVNHAHGEIKIMITFIWCLDTRNN